jgi:predicted nucleic acid-binding protein
MIGGSDGRWARSVLEGEALAAPHLMPAEAANILRRMVLVGDLTADVAAIAHSDLIQYPIVLFPYEPFARRVWTLRGNVTAFDAWYVALAESLGQSLVTLDRRLESAHGPTCSFWLPPRY